MAKGDFNFYKGQDPRELPTYGIPEASRYLRIPKATLHSWVLGRSYPIKSGSRSFRPLLTISDKKGPYLLSFMNLVEAHVLNAIRQSHKIPLSKLGKALEFIKVEIPSKHVLADRKFATDGIDLFIKKLGHLANISEGRQQAMQKLLKAHLRRITRDPSGRATKLYLLTSNLRPKPPFDAPKAVVIDPFVSFGQPVLAGTGIATALIAARYKAGESIGELAGDYGRRSDEIEEAIRCELEAA